MGVVDPAPINKKQILFMTKKELKPILGDFLRNMMSEWFPDMPFAKGIGLSLIDANINKYDYLFELFEDDKGDISIENLRTNIPNTDLRIDLRKISPVLPNRILIITKNDIDKLFTKLMRE